MGSTPLSYPTVTALSMTVPPKAEQTARAVRGMALVINDLEVRPHDLEIDSTVPAWLAMPRGGVNTTLFWGQTGFLSLSTAHSKYVADCLDSKQAWQAGEYPRQTGGVMSRAQH